MTGSSHLLPFFSSRRGLLAAIWSTINVLTVLGFIVALAIGCSRSSVEADNGYYSNYQNEGGGSGDQQGNNNNNNGMSLELAFSSRAMTFCSMWTAVLALALNIFGTIILGWQSPTGQYYTCCSREVHRTTPITLGGFIGALLMYACLTLVCAALFGEFIVSDGQDGDNENGGQQPLFSIRRTSLAFSILCLLLGIMYGGFAAIVFTYSSEILDELEADELEDVSTNVYKKQRMGAGGLVTPGHLTTPRLSIAAKSQSTQHFLRPHDSMYHKHTLSASSLVGSYVNPSLIPTGGPSTPSGSMA